MTTPAVHDLKTAFDHLEFLPDRRTDSANDDFAWADTAEQYRDGAVFVVHYAGSSQWERHPQGDEFVMCVSGDTTMTMHIAGSDREVPLAADQFVVVPQGVWHRFDTPNGAKIMTITPQPTDHILEHPSTLPE